MPHFAWICLKRAGTCLKNPKNTRKSPKKRYFSPKKPLFAPKTPIFGLYLRYFSKIRDFKNHEICVTNPVLHNFRDLSRSGGINYNSIFSINPIFIDNNNEINPDNNINPSIIVNPNNINISSNNINPNISTMNSCINSENTICTNICSITGSNTSDPTCSHISGTSNNYSDPHYKY